MAGQRQAFAAIERRPLLARNVAVRAGRGAVDQVLACATTAGSGAGGDRRIRRLEAPRPARTR